jgi:hypothetical protein
VGERVITRHKFRPYAFPRIMNSRPVVAAVVIVVGLCVGLGIGIGIGAGIWSGRAGTASEVPNPDWFFSQQSSQARVVKASADSQTIFITMDGMSEKATAVTSQPFFFANTLSHRDLASLLSSDPGKNALLICQDTLSGDKVGIPFSIDYGMRSTDRDELSYVGRLMPFDNLTWGRVDAGKEFDSASILSESQFKDGEVVPMEACTLFIDSVEDLVNNVKGVKDAAVDFGRFVADINPFTALLPDSWKDDAASYLKEKGDAKIDATVQGTKDTFVERKPCAMLGNLGEGVLTNAFMSEKQREDHLKASGVCQTDQEKADRLSGKQGIDPLGLVT